MLTAIPAVFADASIVANAPPFNAAPSISAYTLPVTVIVVALASVKSTSFLSAATNAVNLLVVESMLIVSTAATVRIP